jgi:hypothetical protein
MLCGVRCQVGSNNHKEYELFWFSGRKRKRDMTSEEEQAAHRQLWYEALYSGKYQQGVLAMHKLTDQGEVFDALGVGCEVAFKAGVTKRQALGPGNAIMYSYGQGGGVASMPPEVREWYGLSIEGARAIAQYNDGGYSFPMIVRLITRRMLSGTWASSTADDLLEVVKYTEDAPG